MPPCFHRCFPIWAAAVFALLAPALRGDAQMPALSARPPIIRAWGTQAGLPQNTVNAIAQTLDGYLWLATYDGLARFDGTRFKIFGLEDGLPSVSISSLLVDQQGTLWVGTSGSGLCRLKNGKFETIASPNEQPGGDTIVCLQEDSAGQIWVGTSAGLRICRDGKMEEDPAMGRLTHEPILCLLRSRDGSVMWVATSANGLVKYEHGAWQPVAGPPDHENVAAECLLEDRQGRLWAGIGNGVVLCLQDGQWRSYTQQNGLPFAYTTCMAQDANDTIWAGSLDDGLYRFDGTNFNVLRKKDGLSAEDIRSLYCDHEGNLWVGTRTGGLDRLSQRKLMVVSAADGLTNDYTHGLAQTPDGTIWVGTVGGGLYRGGPAGFEAFRSTNEPRLYYYATVFPLLTAPDGSLWWGAAFGLLHWKDNHLADCVTNQPWIRNAAVTALQNDGQGGLWIGTSLGHLVHYENGAFEEFPHLVTRAAITALARQPDGTLWVGTAASGLKMVREDSGEVLTITNGLSSRTSIRALYLDHDNTLWIGTTGAGLCCRRGGKVTRFSASAGLTPRTVSQIVEDDYGNFWLGCSRGIFKVRKADLIACASGENTFVHCRSFGINDGMLAEECTGGYGPAGLKTKSGLICIATVQGVVFIDPKEQHAEEPPPPVLLEEVLVGGQPQALATNHLSANTAAMPRLVIQPGAADIELHYTAIEFATPEKIGFRYRLKGVDANWVESGSRRTAYYQHLPPGQYTFQVQACNADGVWNPSATELAVTALPFFWEAAWFRGAMLAILLCLFAGAVILAVRRRYKHRLARLQTINAIERERLRISKDMHDHVGGMLTQVSQLTDMGLNETDDQSLVKSRLERIGNRARVAVQALDEIVWATNPKNDTLASFAEYVSRFGDEFFEFTKVRCWQEMPAVLPALPLRADIRHNVFLAVREALNNALKHSHCTAVWLKLKLNDHEVTLEIEDDGAGFDPAERANAGNGLANMQARLAECGGRVELSPAPGKGTRLRFIFPVQSPAAGPSASP